MEFNFAKYQKKKQPLHGVLIGKQGAGKSSILGSLAREPMLLLYNSAVEAHSPNWVAKAADEIYPDATSDNLMPVKIDVCEENDNAIFKSILGDKVPIALKIGDKLTADQSWMKLMFLLDYARQGAFRSVAVDSLNSLTFIIQETAGFKNRCSNNKWNETPTYIEMFSQVVGAMGRLKDAGVHAVATCLAQPLFEQGGQALNDIEPTLPAYGVVTKVIPLFQDIAVVSSKDGVPALDFGVKAYRASKDEKGKVKKYSYIEPRLFCSPTGVQLDAIYPDLWHLEEIVKEVVESQKEVEA